MDKGERYLFDVGMEVNHGAGVCEVWNLFIRKISEICNKVNRDYIDMAVYQFLNAKGALN